MMSCQQCCKCGSCHNPVKFTHSTHVSVLVMHSLCTWTSTSVLIGCPVLCLTIFVKKGLSYICSGCVTYRCVSMQIACHHARMCKVTGLLPGGRTIITQDCIAICVWKDVVRVHIPMADAQGVKILQSTGRAVCHLHKVIELEAAISRPAAPQQGLQVEQAAITLSCCFGLSAFSDEAFFCCDASNNSCNAAI